MGHDVVELIMQDHREVERLFSELRTDPAKRPGLLPVLTTLLTAHSRAEEAAVYPVAAGAGGEEDVAHSQEEHVEADELLAELARTDPESSEFVTVLERVVEAVTHHVQEEEETVLPHLRDRLDAARLSQLGDAFLAARAKHLGEQPEDITKAELEQQARNAGVTGASAMGKEQLRQELQRQAGES